MKFTFYQLVVRDQRVHMTPYIVIYPDMVEIRLIGEH